MSLRDRLATGLGPGARRAARAAGAVLAALTAAFVAVEVARQWDEIVTVIRSSSPWWLVAASAGFVVAEAGYAWAWPLTLRRVGHPVRGVTGAATFLVTQTAKFVPGSVWHAVGRVGTADRLGVPKRVVAGSLALEVAASVSAAVAIAGVWGVIAPLLFDDVSRWQRGVEVAGALLAATGVAVAGRQAGARIAGRSLIDMGDWMLVLGWHLLVWVGYGVAAGLLARGLGAELWPTIGAFALSWVVGFLVIGAPAGLGVREAAMTAVLTPTAGADVALAVTVGSRALWTAVQLAGAALALPYLAHRARGAGAATGASHPTTAGC